jgi:beta-mannosidase
MKQSLAGPWKMRAEFIDVGPDKFNMVVSRPEGKFDITGPTRMSHRPPFPKREGFLTAHVPCDVITALMDNNQMEDPLDKDNYTKVKWVEELSWWFFRDFDVSEELYNHEQIRLFIEILDYKAHIIINGVPRFEHKNAFVPFCEDIKRYLRRGKNQIIIRLTGGLEDRYEFADTMSYYSVNGNHNQRTYMRKPAYTYGWDWCRAVPTCGIGRDIYLEGISGAKISAFRADTLSIEGGEARVKLFFEIDNVNVTTADETVLNYTISFDDKIVASGVRELYTTGGYNAYEEEIHIKNAKFWMPNGYGDQHLYQVNASLSCRGAVNEMGEKLIGIRTLKIDHSKLPDGSRNFRFVINGIPVYCKGGNWVPTDSIYMRTPKEKYRLLIEEAKEQHFTMLRMWGGGIYEPDYFYEQCDKNGILLMHDFMYACAYYPDYLDWFCREAEKEAQYQTKRLAHHPCMAIWTGNNEIHESYTDWFTPETNPEYYYGYKIFNHIQPRAVHNNSPLIPYAPSSPFFGSRANDPFAGDIHAWGLMRKLQNPENKPLTFEDFGKLPVRFDIYDQAADQMRFSSEYGFHGPLMKSSVLRYHAGEPLSMESKSWDAHETMMFPKYKIIISTAKKILGEFDDKEIDNYLLYGGLAHGIQYREMMEAMRRREHCSGGLIWMYNDAWPECGWTTVDYYGTRKIAFYFLKRSFALKKIIIRVFDGKGSLVVLNETPEDISIKLEYGYMSFDGKALEVKNLKLDIKKHSFNTLPEFDAPGDLKKGFYFAKADDNDLDPATSIRAPYLSYDFAAFKASILSAWQEGADYMVTLKSETYIPFAQLITDDDRVKMSDNYFELVPGIEKTVRIYNYGKKPELRLVKIVRG